MRRHNAAWLDAFIDGSPWMAQLSAAEAGVVRAAVFGRHIGAGCTACVRGTPSLHWLGVAEGMLNVETVGLDGRSAVLAGVPAGSWFGEGAVLKGELRPYEVTAVQDSLVAFLPRDTFLWLLHASHPFAIWMIGQLNARLGYCLALLESSRLKEPTARVAQCLSEMMNSDIYPGCRRELLISQAKVGQLAGLSRQVANRALQQLVAAAAIRMQYGALEIIDLPLLRRIACGAHDVAQLPPN